MQDSISNKPWGRLLLLSFIFFSHGVPMSFVGASQSLSERVGLFTYWSFFGNNPGEKKGRDLVLFLYYPPPPPPSKYLHLQLHIQTIQLRASKTFWPISGGFDFLWTENRNFSVQVALYCNHIVPNFHWNV